MILLGPAGVGGEILSGLETIKTRGLSAAEIEFTHGVRMSIETAKKVGELNQKLRLSLSVHAPYFINLASKDPQVFTASRQRILDSCERGHHMGARYIVFHAGYYQGREVYDLIVAQIRELMSAIKTKRWNVVLAPETTGKQSQFGDLDELLRLRADTGCELTVDFSHLIARHDGAMTFSHILDKLAGIPHIHAHFSGIEWGPKGEKRHVVMEEDFFLPLARELIKRDINITIISESPVTWEDSLKMQKVLRSL
jgi:deoxyribonuclease IV